MCDSRNVGIEKLVHRLRQQFHALMNIQQKHYAQTTYDSISKTDEQQTSELWKQ